MTIWGTGLYFDGQRPRGREVTVTLDDDHLAMVDADQVERARWGRGSLRRLPAPPGQLRLTAEKAGDARLEVSQPGTVAALTAALAGIGGGRLSTRTTVLTGGLIVAAMLSVAGVVIFGIPAVAVRLVPLVPIGLETAIGDEVRPQIIRLLSRGSEGAACTTPAGRAALDKATQPLIAAARSALAIRIDVINLAVPNAFALPGGGIIVLRGLFDKVAGPDEFAGVIAHELGHVVHRDAMRQLIETAGLGAVIAAVIGDYSGSAISVLVGRALISASYTRDLEAGADGFAIELLTRIGRNPGALGDALAQMTAGINDPAAIAPWLTDHPSTPERIARLKAADSGSALPPLLSDSEWQALKAICR